VQIKQRFRGFLPVIVDMETGGFSSGTDAILEIAATLVRMDDSGQIAVHSTHSFNVAPFEGANIEQSALDFTGIDPWHPFREAIPRKRRSPSCSQSCAGRSVTRAATAPSWSATTPTSMRAF
jgi:ribonuclease T